MVRCHPVFMDRFELICRKLRQASLILPQTGERVRKTFTLRLNTRNSPMDERRPLLYRRTAGIHEETILEEATRHVKTAWAWLQSSLLSRLSQDVLKCSIAYLLGSLATLVLPIAGLLGHQDGKHMVATVTVYFHAARSAGSMVEATGLALIAWAYAALISFASMAVSVFFGTHNLLELGHGTVLILFVGGGLGFVAWLKQKLGNPLVNVACSLTSLAIITVLTKEGVVQTASFSNDKIFQVLKMVIMGVIITAVVSLLVKPKSARRELREGLVKITNVLEDYLTVISISFLTGSDQEMKVQTSNIESAYRSTFNSLVKNLREAKFEYYILGTEDEYKIQARLTKCLEKLAQSLIGLRSAATLQFDLLAESGHTGGTPLGHRTPVSSTLASPASIRHSDRFESLAAITEEPEGVADMSSAEASNELPSSSVSATITEPSEVFAIFISHLGPSMVS